MEVKCKIKVRKLEVWLDGPGSVTAEVAFMVGNMPDLPGNRTRVSVPITDELIKYCEEIVTAQIGERINDETIF